MFQGIPGLRGTEHIGFTVPDLLQAHEFFVDVIGCDFVYALGPMQHADDWMTAHLNVDRRSVVKELRFYRCKFGPNFEVFEYSADPPQQPQPHNNDIGGHHLAFYVDDIDAAVAYLRSRGIRVLGQPVASQRSAEGQRWVYFVSPWGMQFELVSYPTGKAYELVNTKRLWHPAQPNL